MQEYSNSPLVTVIIPAYNTAEFLSECIDSVLAQTYTNLEIIIVDDGSTDETGSVARSYTTNDSRTHLISITHQGLSTARNTGIEKAAGEFLFFLDSDDTIHPHTIAALIESYNATGAELIATPLTRQNPRSRIETLETILRELSTPEALQQLLYSTNFEFPPSVCAKLFKATLFEGIRFPIISIGEDLAVTFRLVAKANKTAIVNPPLYFYRLRQGSATLSEFNPDRVTLLNFTAEQIAFMEAHFPDLTAGAKFRHFVTALRAFRDAPLEQGSLTSHHQRAWRELKMVRFTVLRDSRVASGTRLYALLSYFGATATRFILRLRSSS